MGGICSLAGYDFSVAMMTLGLMAWIKGSWPMLSFRLRPQIQMSAERLRLLARRDVSVSYPASPVMRIRH